MHGHMKVFKKHMLNTGFSRSRKASEANMRLFNVCSKLSTCKFCFAHQPGITDEIRGLGNTDVI